MSNVAMKPKRGLSLFRKIAIGTWKTAYDPSVYGTVEIDMEGAIAYLEAFRSATGRRLTVTHLVAKAMGQVLHEHPDANAILRWNRIYLRDRVALFMQVAMVDEGTGETDLSGITLYDVHEKSLAELVEEMEAKVRRVRDRSDPALERTRGMFRYVPHLLLNEVLRLATFLSYDLNLDLRWAGLPKDPFGSVMITNIGSLGLDMAFVPLIPYSRVPLLLAVGAVKEAAVVRDGALCSRRVMKINATFDHRFLDGQDVAAMSRILRKWLEDPVTHFGPAPG